MLSIIPIARGLSPDPIVLAKQFQTLLENFFRDFRPSNCLKSGNVAGTSIGIIIQGRGEWRSYGIIDGLNTGMLRVVVGVADGCGWRCEGGCLVDLTISIPHDHIQDKWMVLSIQLHYINTSWWDSSEHI